MRHFPKEKKSEVFFKKMFFVPSWVKSGFRDLDIAPTLDVLVLLRLLRVLLPSPIQNGGKCEIRNHMPNARLKYLFEFFTTF